MDQPTEQKLTGLRKRQQIEKTNKTILLWVAIASVIVSICLVLLQFLVRQLIFNQEIINAKSDTNKTLKQNVESAKTLKTNVNKLIADQNLEAARADPSDSNLRVILDALPSTGDPATFANSLQNAILNRSGAKIVSLSSGDASAVAASAPTTAAAAPLGTSTPQTLVFATTLTGSYEQIKTALIDIERVIRPMNVTTLSISGDDKELSINIAGVTYYLPEKSIELGTKSMKPLGSQGRTP